ncbi:MAG: Hsp20/alpha crystallin family protein [Planctomycetes bacterium]|nr:Hsp20/alpha crystallin family protein [Planctomycetota bacterium]
MLLTRVPRNLWACGSFGDLQGELDRLIGDVWGGCPVPASLGYRVDVREDAEHVYVEAELPGLTKEDIEITLEDGVLTIAGEKKIENEEEREGYQVRERRYGRFSRRFELPSVVDEGKVRANLKDGVLLVTLDKREEVKPKRIEVKAD